MHFRLGLLMPDPAGKNPGRKLGGAFPMVRRDKNYRRKLRL
jgi:hypothetical protein